MENAFLTGFFLGISLIFAIGAQNAFVFRQGILQKHVFIVALFCAVSDSILICLGVTGISFLIGDIISEFSKILFGFTAIWLFIYGIIRLHAALLNRYTFEELSTEVSSLKAVILILAIFTFANPHVYLDTVILIGSISQQFSGVNIVFYTLGACIASFMWFFGIAYSSKILTPFMQNHRAWQIFDVLIAIIMFIISYNLASLANWF
jgi:L-lysine exporter family protein LysE/ArgO